MRLNWCGKGRRLQVEILEWPLSPKFAMCNRYSTDDWEKIARRSYSDVPWLSFGAGACVWVYVCACVCMCVYARFVYVGGGGFRNAEGLLDALSLYLCRFISAIWPYDDWLICGKRLAREVCHALQVPATHCNTLQRTATHCNALQRTATHCNTLPRARLDTWRQSFRICMYKCI